MARAGGSHSGGSRSGGSHSSGPRGGSSRSGGSHSSGPRGGSSRSSGPRPSGPRPGGSFGGPRPGDGFGGPRPRGFVPPPPRRPAPGPRPPRGPRRRGSCLGSILAFIIVLVIICMVFSATKSQMQPPKQTAPQEASIKRTPLDASLCTETDYYTDEQGLITSRSKLLTGLKSFYTTTGVQPYVYFTQESDLSDAYANTVYEQLFTDEGHFLLLIHSDYDSQSNEVWNAYHLLGSDAVKVIDDALMDQFWQYYDTNYDNTSLTTEQVLSQTFAQTASVFTVSTAETGDAPAQTGSSRTLILIVFVVLLILIIGIVFMIVRSRKTNTAQTTTAGQQDIFAGTDDTDHQS